MKWHNHKFTTIMMVYAATGTFVSSALAGIGSVLPDVFELKGLVPHRTVTHYPYPYLVVCVGMYLYASMTLSYPAYMLFFVLLGCVCHLFEDCLSRGGIPWKTPFGPRKGFDFYVTRTPSEYMTMWVLVFTAFSVMLVRGFLHKTYLATEAVDAYQFLQGLLKRLT